jgi:ferredoxin
MKVTIEESRCTGAGCCEFAAPELFQVREDGLAVVTREISEEDREFVEAAVESCPTMAITVSDA